MDVKNNSVITVFCFVKGILQEQEMVKKQQKTKKMSGFGRGGATKVQRLLHQQAICCSRIKSKLDADDGHSTHMVGHSHRTVFAGHNKSKTLLEKKIPPAIQQLSTHVNYTKMLK